MFNESLERNEFMLSLHRILNELHEEFRVRIMLEFHQELEALRRIVNP